MERFYVEFNGLPGCGKSTVCRELEKRLAGRMPVVMLSEVKSSAPKSLGFFLKLALSAVFHGDVRVIWAYLRFTLKLPKDAPDRLTCLYSAIRDYLLTLKTCRKTEAGIILCDQGVIQHFLTSFYSAREVTGIPQARRIMRMAERDFAAFRSVNMILDPDLSLARMTGRKEHASRLERLSRGEAETVMKAQDRILETLRRELGDPETTLDADARTSPGENAETILAWILKGTNTPE